MRARLRQRLPPQGERVVQIFARGRFQKQLCALALGQAHHQHGRRAHLRHAFGQLRSQAFFYFLQKLQGGADIEGIGAYGRLKAERRQPEKAALGQLGIGKAGGNPAL